MKADVAIYSHIVDAPGQCMSVSLILGFNLVSVLVPVLVDPVTHIRELYDCLLIRYRLVTSVFINFIYIKAF